VVKVISHQLTHFSAVLPTQARHEPLAVSSAVDKEYFSAIFWFHLSGSFFVCFSPFCAGAAQVWPRPVWGCAPATAATHPPGISQTPQE